MNNPRRIQRLLIANRGEIACRIVATCRAMGIQTVTLHAEDDAALPHTYRGDIAVRLEGQGLAATYLNIDAIIAAAKASGADAIHPGYGFLSENARFAEAVAKAGLLFVGPPAGIIARMGDKAESRILCQSIGVPTVPGYDGGSTDIAVLTDEAKRIGYPVLVKAAAGGGGKGMRIVEQPSELAAAIASARSEAQHAFGDDRLLLEKYLVKPRHIEVQVFSDLQGNHVHLFERECSIQRRHQKIVEESPAPQLPAATRARMVEAAITITRHIGYVGAGTVEFIMDSAGEFYFLEMNTRLQVEHPVTELVTGLDLVKLQLEVAQGSPLPFTQAQLASRGHAVEVRLYAEDPDRGFLPSPGTLGAFSLPHVPHVRCENGYRDGTVVSASYDPMIAKIAAWGADRVEAIQRLIDALEQTRIVGVTNNRNYLLRILRHPDFLAGTTATDFIPLHPELAQEHRSAEQQAQLAAAYVLFGRTAAPSDDSASEHSAWTHPRLAGMR